MLSGMSASLVILRVLDDVTLQKSSLHIVAGCDPSSMSRMTRFVLVMGKSHRHKPLTGLLYWLEYRFVSFDPDTLLYFHHTVLVKVTRCILQEHG